jgi:hypothetical protein
MMGSVRVVKRRQTLFFFYYVHIREGRPRIPCLPTSLGVARITDKLSK